jgi:hypothetical protein
MVRSHRATGKYKGAHRGASAGYQGRHRTRDYQPRHADSMFSRLAGRPTVAQLTSQPGRPGVFPGFADTWMPTQKATRRVKRPAPNRSKGTLHFSAVFRNPFASWS